MNRISFKNWLYLCLFLFGVASSCKKIDNTKEPGIEEFPKDWSEKFFRLPENPHPALVRVAEEIRKQNNKTPFLENFVRTNGFIKWDKADIIIKKNERNIAAMENGASEDTIILLPTVPCIEDIVKSVISVKMNGQMTFKTYLDKFYAANGFDIDPNREKPNADDLVKKIMEFEKKIFGTEQYKITDKRLFKYVTSASVTYESFIYGLFAVSVPDDGGQCLIYTEWVSEDGGQTWVEGESWESPSCSPNNPYVGGGGGGSGVAVLTGVMMVARYLEKVGMALILIALVIRLLIAFPGLSLEKQMVVMIITLLHPVSLYHLKVINPATL